MEGELRGSYRFCGDLSRREAKNFYYSFLLLPPAQTVPGPDAAMARR